jgi:hypothetical protein
MQMLESVKHLFEASRMIDEASIRSRYEDESRAMAEKSIRLFLAAVHP